MALSLNAMHISHFFYRVKNHEHNECRNELGFRVWWRVETAYPTAVVPWKEVAMLEQKKKKKEIGCTYGTRGKGGILMSQRRGEPPPPPPWRRVRTANCSSVQGRFFYKKESWILWVYSYRGKGIRFLSINDGFIQIIVHFSNNIRTEKGFLSLCFI